MVRGTTTTVSSLASSRSGTRTASAPSSHSLFVCGSKRVLAVVGVLLHLVAVVATVSVEASAAAAESLGSSGVPRRHVNGSARTDSIQQTTMSHHDDAVLGSGAINEKKAERTHASAQPPPPPVAPSAVSYSSHYDPSLTAHSTQRSSALVSFLGRFASVSKVPVAVVRAAHEPTRSRLAGASALRA
jgi:hypothetical protein